MKRRFSVLYLLALLLLCGACHQDPWTTKVVQPKSHWLPYSHKKHKKKSRTKTVKMKSHQPKNSQLKAYYERTQ